MFFSKWDKTALVQKGKFYLPVRLKLLISILIAFLWFSASLYVSYPWINDLGQIMPLYIAWLIVIALAFIPGIANAFVISGLFIDNRPQYQAAKVFPNVSIIIAAYNEEDSIEQTLRSVLDQEIPSTVEVIIVNDGSKDKTRQIVEQFIQECVDPQKKFRLIDLPQNKGKANAMNTAFAAASYDLIVTLDADSYLYKDSLEYLVTHMVSGPQDTGAVAGSVLVRNSRKNWITKLQEWDYFHGISVVKRIQSLFQGTLVAQGAYSIFTRKALEAVGGWKDTMGEDIVLTWGLRSRNFRVGYCENAIVFTNVPATYRQFYKQRRRWARGLVEAFIQYPDVIVKLKMNTPFVWYNLLFPYLDFVYLFVFIPGLIAALLFKFYAIVGIMTLLLLPLSLAINGLMFVKQKQVFKQRGLRVRRNLLGFLFYMLTYQFIMTPASLAGYAAEILRFKKSWGTK